MACFPAITLSPRSMKVLKDMDDLAGIGHRQFIDEVPNLIPGWLHDFTAVSTALMLERQESAEIRGPLLEIGVYAGRYFSLLIRSAARNGDDAWGLDTFQYVDEEAVLTHHLARLVGRAPIHMIADFSISFTSAELLARMAARPRFISIDGSHERDDVFWDLRIAEELLAAEGIVAVDDFINPLTLGVNDAVNAFFATPRILAPFAYVQNKLFLCRPVRAQVERMVLEDAIETSAEARAAQWRKDRSQDRKLVEALMWGHQFTLVS